jgi:hypothetical protein
MAISAPHPPALLYSIAFTLLSAALAAPTLSAAAPARPPQQPTGSPSPDLQAASCWVDPPDYFGTTVRYQRRDGSEVQESVGFGAGDRIVHSFHNEMAVCLRAHGEVVLNPGGGILALPRGSWLMMEGRDSTRSVQLRVSPTPSALSYEWSVDGAPAPFAEEADALLALAAQYWPFFQRVADANAEIRRIGRELAALAAAREEQWLRTLAAEAEARTRELERAVAQYAAEGLGGSAVIAQDASIIRITKRTDAGEVTSVYNTDGSPSRNLLSIGGEAIEQVSSAAWEGDRLVIRSSVELGGSALESTLSLALDPSGRLVVESTATPADGGLASASVRRYRRSNG